MIGGFIGIVGGLALVLGLPLWMGATEQPVWWLLVLHLALALIIHLGVRRSTTASMIAESTTPLRTGAVLIIVPAIIGAALSLIPYGIGRWLL